MVMAPEIEAFWAGFWFVCIAGLLLALTHRGASGIPLYQRLRHRFFDQDTVIMFEDTAVDDADDQRNTQLAGNDNKADNRIAMPDNAGNVELSVNAATIESATFNARVDAVLAVVESGKLGQTEAIERIFGCSRSSRPTSVYTRARRAVQARLNAQHTQYPPRSREEQATRDWIDGKGPTPMHIVEK
jgi:hypothetical protein